MTPEGPLLERPLAVLDLETTGASPLHHRITEVALIEVDGGRVVREWSSLVHPGRRIPPAIRALTGITDEMVAAAPSFDAIAPELSARLAGRMLVAHNARFDYGFLRSEFRRAGVRYAARVLCTLRLARRLYSAQPCHSLDALLARHGLGCEARHRALGDARALWALLCAWEREFGRERLCAAAAELARAPALPAALDPADLDELPEAPGAHWLHGAGGSVLYVGCSKNLRARVMAHFSGEWRSGHARRIGRGVARVSWIETGGTLGAALEEARLIKELAPLHNRRLRRSSELWSWRWEPGNGTEAPELVNAAGRPPGRVCGLYGLFGSRAAARAALRALAAEHGLCPLVLGLEQGRAPCFEHQIGRCRGACAGREPLPAHGLRLGQALARLRVRDWPYRGPVAVREGEPGAPLLVLDTWRYLGRACNELELAERLAHGAACPFDPDVYRILVRYFSAPERGRTVIELAPPTERVEA